MSGDKRDMLALDHCRSKQLVGHQMRIEFGEPENEALIVAADVAAGAVGEDLEGNSSYLELIKDLIEIHEIKIR